MDSFECFNVINYVIMFEIEICETCFFDICKQHYFLYSLENSHNPIQMHVVQHVQHKYKLRNPT